MCRIGFDESGEMSDALNKQRPLLVATANSPDDATRAAYPHPLSKYSSRLCGVTYSSRSLLIRMAPELVLINADPRSVRTKIVFTEGTTFWTKLEGIPSFLVQD